MSVMTAERWSTYLCRRRNTPHRIKVPVTSIHPITTKMLTINSRPKMDNKKPTNASKSITAAMTIKDIRTRFSNFWIFSELSDVLVASSVADEFSFPCISLIWPITFGGSKNCPMSTFFAADRLSERLLRFSTVKFAWLTTNSKVVVVLEWNLPWPVYNTTLPAIAAHVNNIRSISERAYATRE
jgi:hypothetical protein